MQQSRRDSNQGMWYRKAIPFDEYTMIHALKDGRPYWSNFVIAKDSQFLYILFVRPSAPPQTRSLRQKGRS